MKVHIVVSREKGICGCKDNQLDAEKLRDSCIRNEEMAGGRPSVWIDEQEIESNHIPIRDNFKLIETLLDFTDPNSFYFIQIIKRRKENPHMKTGQAILDNFYVYEKTDLVKLKDKIVDRCIKHNARAYINLNKLDLERIAMYTQKNIVDLVIQGQFKAVKNAYSTACGNHTSEKAKRWVIDVDEKDLPFLSKIRELIQSLHLEIPKNSYKIVAEIPTKSGVHIISEPFNLKKFNDELGLHNTMITVHKNSPTLLYVP